MQMEILQSGLERRPGRAIQNKLRGQFSVRLFAFRIAAMFDDIKKVLRATSGKQRSNMDFTEYASDLGRRSATE